MKILDSGVVGPKGFQVGSCASGIKKKKLDMTLIVSDFPSVVAGSFTTNTVKAAPVTYDQHIVAQGHTVKAIVINSGNANACTGIQGDKDVKQTASLVAENLHCKDEEVLVCSTGVIGVPLPMDKVSYGISCCVQNLSSSIAAARDAALAICTTDTFSKEIAVTIDIEGKPVTIGGMAKGSGMIHPNMATMLSFITTDAQLCPRYVQQLLKTTVQDSYNMISVDGDTSTNDTVLVLANGASETALIDEHSAWKETFSKAFLYVHTELAKKIVLDGEGAGKFIEVLVKGCDTKEDARLLSRAVISSNLVKTAFFGEDANWGRMVCAMGYSTAQFDPNQVSITYESEAGSITVMKQGMPIPFDEVLAKKILQEKVIKVIATVGVGEAEATAWGCDLSYEYVRINGDYRS